MNNRKLFKNISFFTFFNVINSVIPFLLLPILTTYLSPEDYGIVDIFLNISMIATPIVGISVVQSISRYYFEKIDLPSFVTTVFVILLATGMFFIIISVFVALLAQDFLIANKIPHLLIVVAIVHTFFSQIAEMLLILWRVSYNTVKFGVFRVAKTILDLSLAILLIVRFGMGWEGRIIPQVLVAVLFGIIAVVLLFKQGSLVRLKVNKVYRKQAVSFSLPLVFHSLGGNIIGFSDRFFILFMLGLNDVGIYSVGYQIGMVIGLLQNSFNQAWVPHFFEKLKEDRQDEKIKIVKITYVYFGLMLLAVVVFYWLTPFIYKYFIGKAFGSGLSVVLWILLGYAFNGMYKMVVNYLFYLKKTLWIAYTTIGAACLNLVLNFLMIKINGIEGAAQASAITFFVLFLVIFGISARSYPMPWKYGKL